ncbi:MAG TPA: hypothetical protein VH877_10185 [Polyangia bacterium]|jgi:hypothetical protein|nr:hypothetical protein [Polyangia bacterium]
MDKTRIELSETASSRLLAALHRMRRTELLILLERALERLPASMLHEVIGDYLPAEALAAGPAERPKGWRAGALLAQVRAFRGASRRGEYYEEATDSAATNCSTGTSRWITRFTKLLEEAVKWAESDPGEARLVFDLLFELLRRIEYGDEDIVLLGDGRLRRLGIDWDKVLPAYFRCLASCVTPEEYKQQVESTLADFIESNRSHYLAQARVTATPEQRAVLDKATNRR